MKYIFPLLATTIITATAISSCKKDDPEEVTPEATITISNPVAGDTITVDTFNITGSITATGSIHGYDVKLVKVSDGSQVFFQDIDDHGTSFSINVSAVPAGITTETDLKAVVDVILDHEGNKTTKEVTFHYVP